VQHGDRIAQLIVSKVEEVDMTVAESLAESERDRGGHGSTGR
jgi:dUTP pyrophosphatase